MILKPKTLIFTIKAYKAAPIWELDGQNHDVHLQSWYKVNKTQPLPMI